MRPALRAFLAYLPIVLALPGVGLPPGARQVPGGPPAAAQARPRIGVLFWHDSPNDRAALEGVRDGFSIAGIDPVLEIAEARGDDAAARSALRDFEARGLDLVLALGTGAAVRARDEVKTRPVVFTAVTDPIGSGIVDSAEGSGRNLCGVASGVDPAATLRAFRRAVPGLRRLAVVLDPANPVSRREVDLVRAAGAAVEPPVEVEAREAPVEELRRPGGLRAASAAALERADALWIPLDIEVYSRADQAAEAAAEWKVPVLTTAPAAARTAACVCVAPEFRTVGRTAVVLAVRALRGEDPGKMPLLRPRSVRVVVNLEAARRTRVELPLDLLAVADEFAGVAGGR